MKVATTTTKKHVSSSFRALVDGLAEHNVNDDNSENNMPSEPNRDTKSNPMVSHLWGDSKDESYHLANNLVEGCQKEEEEKMAIDDGQRTDTINPARAQTPRGVSQPAGPMGSLEAGLLVVQVGCMASTEKLTTKTETSAKNKWTAMMSLEEATTTVQSALLVDDMEMEDCTFRTCVGDDETTEPDEVVVVNNPFDAAASSSSSDSNSNNNKLDPDGSLRPSSITKMDVLAAAATAEILAKEVAESGMCSESGTSDDDEEEEEEEGVVGEDLPQKDEAGHVATDERNESGKGLEEEKKEDAMDNNTANPEMTAKVDSPIEEPEVSEEESLEPEKVGNVSGAANDTHSPSDTDDSKTPVDASGVCSLEREGNEMSFETKDPPEAVIEEKEEKAAGTTSKLPAIKEMSLSEALQESALEPSTIATPKVANISPPVDIVLPTLQASDVAIAAITEAPLGDKDSPNSQQSRNLLLANKDKEGFGLLARGESFQNGQQQQQQQQQPHSPPQNQYSDQARVPQEPDAVHRRGDSSFADADDSGLRSMDENSNRPMDDNSWRPSHVSYPASPQGVPNPQAVAFSNGGYMMMPPPHNQGQPPHAFIAQPPAMQPMLHHQSSFHSHQSQIQAQMMGQTSFGYQTMPAMAPMPSPTPAGGKRKIKLRLQEEILARPSHARRTSFFFGARSSRKLLKPEPMFSEGKVNEVDRGTITVSWFEGTSSAELQEHVNKSVSRKLKLDDGQALNDIRILDTKVDPPEEIVLCPYIPCGSEFVLRYKLKLASGRTSPTFYGPPDSPSAAPSPFPSHGNLGSLDASQLSVLRKQLDAVQAGEPRKTSKYRGKASRLSPIKPMSDLLGSREVKGDGSPNSDGSDAENESETNTLQPENENSVDAKLRQITELLLLDKQKAQQQRYPKVEKRDVIFVLANYFVLFVAIITISVEMQSRAPRWLSWMEAQLENVANCSADQDALFKCVSNGEFAGLFASVILWVSRSALTKQIFLLGFDSPGKLWTVFYESLVGAFAWGCSYMFIRRGMNPDTRPQFIQRYWKDAVYGSLAGFNATFLKQILKNLIPKEAVEEAFNDRQLKILSWLPTFS